MYDLNRLELLLNIAWLLAVAGIILATAAPQRRRCNRRYIVVGVFVCIALLLFPVISASDDLHPGGDLSDDAAWRHEKRGLGGAAPMLLVLVFLAGYCVRQSNLFHVHTAVIPLASTRLGYLRLDAGRAPPGSF